jgi:hypothetical protein
VRRDPDRLPSLETLGERLGDAAAREIAAEQERDRRRRFRIKPFLLGAIVATLVGAGAVTATDVFTGSGDPVPEERQGGSQPGVLTDSAADDPGGGLPWAMRVFVGDGGKECMQLGRLRDGVLGMVQSGQFRPYQGEPNGMCGDLREFGYFSAVEQRSQPAERTIAYGLVRSDDPVRVRFGDEVQTVRPGALGAYIAVFEGVKDLSTGTVSVTVDGRRITRPLGG